MTGAQVEGTGATCISVPVSDKVFEEKVTCFWDTERKADNWIRAIVSGLAKVPLATTQHDISLKETTECCPPSQPAQGP